MTQILAYDNCFNSSSVSLKNINTNIIKTEEIANNSFKNLVPVIQKMTSGHLINEIILTIGPGSFTGLRIGIATALGIKSVNNCNLIGCSTFDAYLNQFFIENPTFKSSDKSFVILLDAKRRGLVYLAKTTSTLFFESDYENDFTGLIKIDELEDLVKDSYVITNLPNMENCATNCEKLFFIDKINSKILFKMPQNRTTNNIIPIYLT